MIHLKRTNTRISPAQFDILNMLLSGYVIKRRGQQTGYLVKTESGIDNYHPNAVKINTLNYLLKKKIIAIDERVTIDKRYTITEKGTHLFLSMSN